MNKRNLKLLSVLLSLSFCLGGCSNGKEVVFEKGQITSEEKETEKKELEEAELYRNVTEGSPLKVRELNSWYFDNILSERAKICYGEIKNAISTQQKEVVFSKGINEEEFQKVMNIIYLDTPESFPLKYKFKYQLDENQNVKKAEYEYAFSKAKYDKALKVLKQEQVEFISSERKKTDKMAALDIYKTIVKDEKAIKVREKDKRVMNDKSTIVGKDGERYNLANSLYMIYMLRSIGIDCFVKCGTLTSNELTPKSEEFKSTDAYKSGDYVGYKFPPTFKDYDISKFKETKKEKDYNVTLFHPEYLYTWVVAKINGKWVNLDPTYDAFSNYFKNTKTNTCFCVPDYILAHSRNFNYNENIFSVTPTSDDISNLFSVSDKSFILHKTDQQISEYVNKEVEEIIKNSIDSLYHQFDDKETMEKYLKQIKKEIKKVNEEKGNIINDYNVNIDYSRLLIEINNIVYS